MMDTTGICGESDSLLPEANEHPARYTEREKDRKKEREEENKIHIKMYIHNNGGNKE